MENSNLKVCIFFAYTGLEKGSKREEIFWKTIEVAKQYDPKPIVVVNEDTDYRDQAKDFYADARHKEVEVIKVWSVDTCQMWLHGWGHVFDNYPNVERIVQIPGDIDKVEDEIDFVSKLKGFLATHTDIVIGDFKISDRFGSKMLIDTYGTYPLLANWFPRLTQEIFKLSLSRPRSEFLNIKAAILRELLNSRKFAYEQTINLLIGAWDFEKEDWRYDLIAFDFGHIKDDGSHRQYLAALDQIERTERLIKLRWREIYQPIGESDYVQFSEFYNGLDRHSTAIREAAGITIRALLGLSSATPPTRGSSAP